MSQPNLFDDEPDLAIRISQRHRRHAPRLRPRRHAHLRRVHPIRAPAQRQQHVRQVPPGPPQRQPRDRLGGQVAGVRQVSSWGVNMTEMADLQRMIHANAWSKGFWPMIRATSWKP